MDAARPVLPVQNIARSTTTEGNSPSTAAAVSQDASNRQDASVEGITQSESQDASDIQDASLGGSTQSKSSTSLRTTIRQIK